MRDDDDILLRRIVTLAAPAPLEPVTVVDRLHKQVADLMRAHADLTVSPWELGHLVGGDMTAVVLRTAFEDLVREARIRVIGPAGLSSRAPVFGTCLHCGEWLESVHPRALEHIYEQHLADAHGDRTTVDFTVARGSTH